MSTKVTGMEGSPPASVGARQTVQGRETTLSAGQLAAESSTDQSQQVQITGTARQLADLEQVVRALPPVNDARIAQVRAAIEKGTYAVRPQQIADQLLSLEHALSGLAGSEEKQDGGAGHSES